MGKSKILKESTSSGAAEIFDFSVRTTTNVTVTGSLSRNSRVVSGGEIEMAHNDDEFLALHVPTNVTWSGTSCCHPISRTLESTLSGTKEGTFTTTFGPSCGQATITKLGATRNITLSHCE